MNVKPPRDAGAVMPCVQQLSQSDLFMDRLKALKILVDLLARADGSLDPDTAEAMRQAITLALYDKRTEVRWEAVDYLERRGTPEMVPALKELAVSDPAGGATEDEIAIRKNAAKAIRCDSAAGGKPITRETMASTQVGMKNLSVSVCIYPPGFVFACGSE